MTGLIGWARVWLLRKERCACQSYLCPYTLGRGMHVTNPRRAVVR